jgi:hypothetical protein
MLKKRFFKLNIIDDGDLKKKVLLGLKSTAYLKEFINDLKLHILSLLNNVGLKRQFTDR